MSLSALVALALVASTAALSNLQVSGTPTPDKNVTVTWTSDSSDTTPLTLALFSADSNQTFAGGLALVSNVDLQANQVSFLFPELVSPGQYTVGFQSATNASDVVTSSPEFAVQPPTSATASGTTTASGTATASRTGSGSTSATATAPPSGSSALSSALNSISSAASSAASSARSSVSAAASGSSASSSSSSSSSAGAALALKPMWSTGMSLAVSVVLGGFAVGAVAL